MNQKEDADFTCRRCWKARPGSLLAEYEGPMRRPVCQRCKDARSNAMAEVNLRRIALNG